VTSEAPTAARAAPAVNSGQGGASSGIAWLALLLVLGLAAGAGWFFVEAHKREADLFARLQLIESTTMELDAATRGLETTTLSLSTRTDALAGRTESLESLAGDLPWGGGPGSADPDPVDPQEPDPRWEPRVQAAVAESVAHLEGSIARQSRQLQELTAQLSARGTEPTIAINRDSWMLAEVDYLLRLANQRMILTGDTATAEALLSSADKILRDLDDASLLAVRRAVTSDLAAIRAVPKIDTEGSFLRLAALVEQVDRLVIFSVPGAEIPMPTRVTDNWQGKLRQGYEEALAKLSSYVIVRRRDTPAEALMDPHWERLVRENLRMLFEQAQMALLSGNQLLYRESLERSRHWVAEFFVADELAAEAMEREIADLVGQTITVDLPDISDSMREFDAAVAGRRNAVDTGQASSLQGEAEQELLQGESPGRDSQDEG
jgi:uroporphyrin-3 C-methyltransferase